MALYDSQKDAMTLKESLARLEKTTSCGLDLREIGVTDRRVRNSLLCLLKKHDGNGLLRLLESSLKEPQSGGNFPNTPHWAPCVKERSLARPFRATAPCCASLEKGPEMAF